MISVNEAREYYTDSESAHDFEHVLRVMMMAERLARAEGADVEIVHAAALLHDIARLEEDQSGLGDHAQMAADRARNILLEQGVNLERAAAVVHAIAAHRYRGSVQPQTLEAKILFDADKLDSIGAIGIARAYAIAGSLNQPLWSEPDKNAIATRDQRNASHSPVAEFMVKLRHVRERLHTAAAKKIAAERHEFMSQFFERLGREIRGEF
jgi:uncharacterized protein